MILCGVLRPPSDTPCISWVRAAPFLQIDLSEVHEGLRPSNPLLNTKNSETLPLTKSAGNLTPCLLSNFYAKWRNGWGGGGSRGVLTSRLHSTWNYGSEWWSYRPLARSKQLTSKDSDLDHSYSSVNESRAKQHIEPSIAPLFS